MLILKSISPHSTIYCPNSKAEKLIGIVTPLSKSQIGCQSQAKKFNEIEQNQSLVQEGQNIYGTQKLIQGTPQNIQTSPSGKKPSWSEKPGGAQNGTSAATAQ